VWKQVEVEDNPPIDLIPKSQSPAQRRLTARCSPSLRRALRSSRPYMATMTHSNGNGSLATTRTDRKEFVREVLTLIHVRRLPSHMSRWRFIHVISFPSDFPFILVLIDRSLVRGSTLDGILCAHVAYVGALVYLSWRTCWVVARDFMETVTGTSPYRWACEWDGGLALASPTIRSCQGQSAQRGIRASEKHRTNINWRTGNCIAV
jgi:hypothetical protein